MQAPGRPDEDRGGSFEHGGWAQPYAESVAGSAAGQSMANTGGLLLGRRTYVDLFSVWPKRPDNPFTEVLNNTQKCVASRTLEEPLPWSNSTLLKGDTAEAVARLSEQPGKSLVVLGSGELVQSLMRRNLVDAYVLLIHPLTLGSGRRLFNDGISFAALRLVGTRTTPSGVMFATYRGRNRQRKRPRHRLTFRREERWILSFTTTARSSSATRSSGRVGPASSSTWV